MVRIPSRYEDLDLGFRGQLKPDVHLIAEVKKAFSSMEITGGIRFLPIYGLSGAGKSSAALELNTHLPELRVYKLPRSAIEDNTTLYDTLKPELKRSSKGLIVIIDQYEEAAAQRASIPTDFVERIALLDRGELKGAKVLFVWLTTSLEFQKSLVGATSRNRRILACANFQVVGPSPEMWPNIIDETFQFHNNDKQLADYHILDSDLSEMAMDEDSLGSAISELGHRLVKFTNELHDMSEYQVVMLWPVTDGLRIQRIQQFTQARDGYKLDWYAWYRQLNTDDRRQLPLSDLNKARTYFDVRLIPVAAADLKELCRDLDREDIVLQKSYTDRFKLTHLYSIVSGAWNPQSYAPLRERSSKRADGAKVWYESVTGQPTLIGRRLAKIFTHLGFDATYERTLTSPNGKVRADVFIEPTVQHPKRVIIELKAFSSENTMPSSIADAVKVTLRRHAQFAGFLARQ